MKALIVLLSVLCWMLIAVAVVKADELGCVGDCYNLGSDTGVFAGNSPAYGVCTGRNSRCAVNTRAYINKKRVIVDTTHIINPWMTTAIDKQVTKAAIDLWRNVGVKIAIGKIKRADDPFSDGISSRLTPELYGEKYAAPFLYEFNYWVNKIKRRIPNYHIHIVTTPPWGFDGVGDWKDGYVNYMAGYALQSAAPRGCVVTASGATYTTGGISRINQSILIKAQEIGHCLGAEHIDSEPNIMHSDAGRVLDVSKGNFLILPESVEQIRRVIK